MSHLVFSSGVIKPACDEGVMVIGLASPDGKILTADLTLHAAQLLASRIEAEAEAYLTKTSEERGEQ